MIKFGCMALVATACAAAMPAAHAKGNFFVAGQLGQATFDDTGFEDDTASTHALSAGYRWQAGPIVQIGIEAGFGTIDESGDRYDYRDTAGYVYTGGAGLEADYRNVGANARIDLGEGSRWFAVARVGYMAYDMDAYEHIEARYNGALVATYSDAFSDSGAGAYFGGGIGFDATRDLSFSLNYSGYAYSNFETDYYGDVEVGTASTTTVGVELRF